MLNLESPDDVYFAYQTAFCSLPFTKLIINSWGSVSMCCHQVTQLGKLTEEIGLLDLWNSPLAQDIRKKTAEGELHPVCKSWNTCPFMVRQKKMRSIKELRRNAYPTYLEICLPDKHCNVGGENPTPDNPACIMCRRNFEQPQQPDLTEFMCRKALPVMPYLRNFCVLGIAEPFWKDAAFRILDLVEFHRYRHQICFNTNTNGICVTERVADKFFDSVTYSDISWSIDAATASTHTKIRRLDTFDLVVANLKRWLEMRQERGTHKTTIYNNINMLNVDEMVPMVEMAADLGVDELIMLPTHDQAGVVKLGELVLCKKNLKTFKKHAEAASKRAQELSLRLVYPTRFDLVPSSAVIA